MAVFKFLDINGVSTFLDQLKNMFVKKTDVESSLSSSSTNPVQGKVIYSELSKKSNSDHTHNYAGSSSAGGVANSASKWATARNINGMTVDGTANRVNYGTCSTAAATAAKTVACTGFTLVTGAEITVKFTVTNSASNPTLNVNSTGAKAIYYNGSAITAGYLKANKTYSFRYNGTQYDLVGDVDTNTTYSLSSFGVTATAAELNKLDGCTATVTELNYVDGVTSNIQTQLNGKLSTSGTAAKATADASGQNIADTYIKGLSVSGKTITYTKGDGGTGTITTQDTTYSVATTSSNGLMSSTDKTKLDGIATGANKTVVDSALSSTSTNPVQNKIINSALGSKVSTSNVTNTISSGEGSKIPTSQAVIDYVGDFGGGSGIAYSIDINVTLPSKNWQKDSGSSSQYVQSATVVQLREGMTPIVLLDNQATDEQIYAYNLITDYSVGNGTIKFYADAAISTDISIVIKGIPTQEVEYVDNTLLVSVSASGFQLNEETQRYEQTLTVDGMTAGLCGMWDILRSGAVLTIEESKIASIITDVIRLENAIKIVCTEVPAQNFTLVLYGTFKDAVDGDILLSDVNGILGRVSTLEDEVNTIKNDIMELNSNKLSQIEGDGYVKIGKTIIVTKQVVIPNQIYQPFNNLPITLPSPLVSYAPILAFRGASGVPYNLFVKTDGSVVSDKQIGDGSGEWTLQISGAYTLLYN